MSLTILLACARTTLGPTLPPTSSVKDIHPSTPKESLCSFQSTPEACLGQTVTWTGSIPTFVHSHPIVPTPRDELSVQSYIEVGDSQYILLSSRPHNCDGLLEAKGTLGEINLGGPQGTRGYYRNYYLAATEISCVR